MREAEKFTIHTKKYAFLSFEDFTEKRKKIE